MKLLDYKIIFFRDWPLISKVLNQNLVAYFRGFGLGYRGYRFALMSYQSVTSPVSEQGRLSPLSKSSLSRFSVNACLRVSLSRRVLSK